MKNDLDKIKFNVVMSLTAVTLFALLLSACTNSSISKETLALNADSIANRNDFKRKLVPTSDFTYTTYQKITSSNNVYHVYIEGDGNAWKSKYSLSDDPTPHNPLMLKLAVQDPHDNVIYFARPCQFSKGRSCHNKYWSKSRYSKTVVDSMQDAINSTILPDKNTKIHLVGFSGGATLALLIATNRQDIASIRTLSGNLDHEHVTSIHNTTPLNDSLNPVRYIETLKKIPQIHYAGGEDKMVPPIVAEKFVKRMDNPRCVTYKIISGADHGKKWDKYWPGLVNIIPTCSSN